MYKHYFYKKTSKMNGHYVLFKHIKENEYQQCLIQLKIIPV